MLTFRPPFLYLSADAARVSGRTVRQPHVVPTGCGWRVWLHQPPPCLETPPGQRLHHTYPLHHHEGETWTFVQPSQRVTSVGSGCLVVFVQKICGIWSTFFKPFSHQRFSLFQFWMSAVATTMPVPCGAFMPVFLIGKENLSFVMVSSEMANLPLKGNLSLYLCD